MPDQPTLEEQLTEAVQAVTRVMRDLEAARRQFSETEERLLARLDRCGDDRDRIMRLIRARDWKPNATIAQEYVDPYADPADRGYTILFHQGERVQVLRDGGIVSHDGHVFYGEPELETDPGT